MCIALSTNIAHSSSNVACPKHPTPFRYIYIYGATIDKCNSVRPPVCVMYSHPLPYTMYLCDTNTRSHMHTDAMWATHYKLRQYRVDIQTLRIVHHPLTTRWHQTLQAITHPVNHQMCVYSFWLQSFTFNLGTWFCSTRRVLLFRKGLGKNVAQLWVVCVCVDESENNQHVFRLYCGTLNFN